MEKATDTDRIFKFLKLYKKTANLKEIASGVATLRAVKILKRALNTSQDDLGAQSTAQLG